MLNRYPAMQFAATGTQLPPAAALEVRADKGQLSAGNQAMSVSCEPLPENATSFGRQPEPDAVARRWRSYLNLHDRLQSSRAISRKHGKHRIYGFPSHSLSYPEYVRLVDKRLCTPVRPWRYL